MKEKCDAVLTQDDKTAASPGMQTRAAAAAAAAAQLLAQRLNNPNGLLGGSPSGQDQFNGPRQGAKEPRKQLPTLWLERKTKEQQFKQVRSQNPSNTESSRHYISWMPVDCRPGYKQRRIFVLLQGFSTVVHVSLATQVCKSCTTYPEAGLIVGAGG